MQYAILHSDGVLQAVLDLPGDQPTSWEGPSDFQVLLSTDFGIPAGANFSDYSWNAEAHEFDYVGSQEEVTGNIFNLTNEQLDALVQARVDAAVQRALEAQEGGGE